MAITVWNLRTTGSDSNGGGFDASLSGTDYSQSDTPIATGTVTSATTTVTATTAIFTAAMVGNYITDGTTWVKITAFTSSAIVTVSASPSWTAASIKVGGGLATWIKALGLQGSSDWIQVKGGAYSGIAANPTINAGSVVPGTGTFYNRITGYVATPGDATLANKSSWPIIQGATGITTLLPLGTKTGFLVEYLTIDCNNVASTTCISGTGSYCQFRYLALKNFKTAGLNYPIGNINGSGSIYNVEVTGGGSAATAAILSGANAVRWCFVHDNACPGVSITSAGSIEDCIIVNNSGASSDGIVTGASLNITIRSNTIVSNGRAGIRFTSSSLINIGCIVKNNILALNAGFGLDSQSNYTTYGNDDAWDGNFYGHTGQVNAGGDRNQLGTGSVDLFFTVDPFNSKATGDWSLNNTANGGAVIRAAAPPGSIIGSSTSTFLDGGASQHQDSGGTSGMLYKTGGG